MVYGSGLARALELRELDGSGRLKTGPGQLLPFNVNGLPNAPSTDPSFFLAGDVRANEQIGLTALHTLFVREHNYWAERLARFTPPSDDLRYELARIIVWAEIQAITYREWLPALLGPEPLPPYRGYDPSVDATIANVFSTAAFRVGHTLLNETLLRLDRCGLEIPAGHISLADAFFNPQEVIDHGIDPILRGLARQPAQRVDPFVVDPVRNFLFGPPGAGGLDLASLNIQRGRDHGLPGYNRVRMDYGLDPKASFDEVSSDPAVRAALSSVYASVDEIDPWVGGLAEDHLPRAMVGELIATVLRDQFRRLRDGDRFFYQRILPPLFVRVIESQRLSDIIRRNTQIRGELQRDVFHVHG
jgi:hypothetical protein